MTDLAISKRDEKYINNLLSKDAQVVTETIEEIRNEGSITLLPLLIDLLKTSINEEVDKHVYNLLCELKLKESVPILVDAISNEKYSGIKEVLIRTCWENGLDYTPYLTTFIDIVIHDEFMNAFEAFTVIENMEGTIAPELISKMTDLLEKAIPESAIEKKTLLFDLIRILPEIK